LMQLAQEISQRNRNKLVLKTKCNRLCKERISTKNNRNKLTNRKRI